MVGHDAHGVNIKSITHLYEELSSAVYAKGVIEEVVTPLPISVNVPTAGSLDDSQNSWSSLELDEPAHQGGLSICKSKALLRGKIQAGVQGRVNQGESRAR